jgi:carotenoid phi-ring synthase / carotenoid chi-ring synthase
MQRRRNETNILLDQTPMTHQPTQPIIIIGGGLAGLVTAVRLAQRGLQPILLEAHEQVGGRLRNEPAVTFTHNGRDWTFPQEHGIHGLWQPYVNLKALLQELEMAPRYVPAQDETWILGEHDRVRVAKIGHDIRASFIPAPFHYLRLFLKPSFLRLLNLVDIAALFRVSGSLFMAMSIDPLKEQQPLHGLSLADLTKGWTPHLRAMFAGLARNALAAPPEEIPAAGFIAFLRFYTLLRRDAWGFDFLPAGGGEAICYPLADKIRALGGQVLPGHTVQRLERQSPGASSPDGGWLVTAQTADGAQHTFSAGQIVLALDAPAAQNLLQNSPGTAEIAATRYFPPGVATAIIRLWYDGQPNPRVSESGMFSGQFAVHNFFWLHRLQESYRAWSQETGGSAVEMHIYGSPHLLEQPDALLLAQAINDANRAFPELRERRLHAYLQRNPPSHTLFGLGTAEQNLAVATPWPGLYACGDWVYDPNPALYLERAATTALIAANYVLADNGRSPFPILPHPEPEPFAGWLARRWHGFRRRYKSAKTAGA